MFSSSKSASNSHICHLRYHIAHKKIPCVNEEGKTHTPSKPNGWKLEMFIFDVFQCAHNLVAFEVSREEEFSPLKNAPGTLKDSPETCRADVSKLHKSWLNKLGVEVEESPDGKYKYCCCLCACLTFFIDNESLCEVSPLLAQAGEDLKDLAVFVQGKKVVGPTHLTPTIRVSADM